MPDPKKPDKLRFEALLSPHDLRHTAATMMEENEIDMQMISRFLAHKDESTTRRIYAKPRPQHLAKAAEVVDLRKAREKRERSKKPRRTSVKSS